MASDRFAKRARLGRKTIRLTMTGALAAYAPALYAQAASPLIDEATRPVAEQPTTVPDDRFAVPEDQQLAPGSTAPDAARGAQPDRAGATVTVSQGWHLTEDPAVEEHAPGPVADTRGQTATPAGLHNASGPTGVSASTFDAATMRRIVERLVSLDLLPRIEDAETPDLFADAVRAFQTASGIAPTGALDRDTAGRLLSQ